MLREEANRRSCMRIHYEVCGVVISSEEPLPALARRETAPTREGIEFGIERSDPTSDELEWFRQVEVPGRPEPFMSAARVDGGYLVRFPSIVDFWIRADGAVIKAVSRSASIDTIEQLLLDQVLPQALNLRGLCSLHASSVVIDEAAVAFVGASGEGKSTLAAAFVPPARLVGDDCLTLQVRDREVIALPSYPSVRLRDDSAQRHSAERRPVSARMTWKYRVDVSQVTQPVSLRRVYLLSRHDEVRIRERSPVTTLGEMIRHVHRLDPEDRSSLHRELATLSDVLERVPARELAYPRRYEALDTVRAAVLEDLRHD